MQLALDIAILGGRRSHEAQDMQFEGDDDDDNMLKSMLTGTDVANRKCLLFNQLT